MYKIILLAAFLTLIPLTSSGIIALSPILIPILLAALFFAAIPFFTFYGFIKRVEIVELAKRLRNKGYRRISEQVLINGRDMSGINLNGTNFEQSSMEGFDMSKSNLKNAKFSGSNCNWINLSNSSARKSRFNRTDLKHAQLNDADFKESSFYYANLKGSNIENTDFRKANLKGANLKRVTRGHTLWRGAVFNAATQLPFSKDVAFKKGMLYVG